MGFHTPSLNQDTRLDRMSLDINSLREGLEQVQRMQRATTPVPQHLPQSQPQTQPAQPQRNIALDQQYLFPGQQQPVQPILQPLPLQPQQVQLQPVAQPQPQYQAMLQPQLQLQPQVQGHYMGLGAFKHPFRGGQ